MLLYLKFCFLCFISFSIIQEEFEKADAFVLVYSVVDKASFTRIEQILIQLQDLDLIRSRSLIIVANKIDLARSRAVSSQGNYKTKYNLFFFAFYLYIYPLVFILCSSPSPSTFCFSILLVICVHKIVISFPLKRQLKNIFLFLLFLKLIGVQQEVHTIAKRNKKNRKQQRK